ncbi:hypothetical protein GF389_00995 [Candidatus Dojkabacteria bacterium]|nr:hypothetical protein [Candidatus Dojkabacteria bacterium]
MSDNYTYEVENLTDTKYKVSVKVKKEYFQEQKEKAYNKLAKTVEVKGFRAGKAPRNVVEAKLGAQIYEETINTVFPEVALEIVKEEKLNPVGQLEYHLEKVSDDDGLQYHFEFEGIGEIELPDFSKLKVKKDEVKVTTKEVEAVIDDMLKQGDAKNSEKKEEKEDKKQEKKQGQKQEKKQEATDDWAKSLKIDGVKDVKSLKEMIKNQLKMQKERMAEDKYSADIIDKAVEKAEIKVPEVLVEKELNAKEEGYKKKIEELGLEYETFLKTKNVNLEDLKKDWKEEATKRIAREILLVEVAKANQMKVSKDEIEAELNIIQDPKLKAQYETEQGRNFIASVIIQQKAVKHIKDQVSSE